MPRDASVADHHNDSAIDGVNTRYWARDQRVIFLLPCYSPVVEFMLCMTPKSFSEISLSASFWVVRYADGVEGVSTADFCVRITVQGS